MKPWTMVWRGAAFYWRTHLGVILGSAVAAMVLIGSLLVGDSVKATLKRQALARVGKANVALVAGDRFFRQALADDVGHDAAPILMLRGSISVPGGEARINQAQVLGVDDRFWKLAPEGKVRGVPPDSAIINQRTATQLGAKAGDTIIVRIEKPGAFSRDAPLSGDESDIVAIRVTIADIVGDDGFGRFSLAASQVPPFTVFLPIEALQKQLEFAGKANLLLSTDGPEHLAAAVAAKWQLADASLELRALPDGAGLELRSPRVFLDETIVVAAPEGPKALTYFVNEIRAGDLAVPYSMVTGVESGHESFLPADLGADEIVLNAWTAENLNVEDGEEVTLKYFVIGEQRTLLEKSRTFKVVAIVPMSEPALNSSWMPEFPGLHDAESCRDWKPGFAIDLTKLRDKDQDYWDQYRGTPKAFINLKVAQEMWGNRWGDVTSIRYPDGQNEAELATAIRTKLTPPAIGLQVVPIREQALAATNAPVDFGELFVSFSFFLIAAAAALTGLLFVFTLEQRNAEAGTELALGLPARLVRRLLLCEGALLAMVGTLLGVAGALIFTKLVLRALSTVWNDAVGAVHFEFAATPGSLIGGSIASVLMAVFAMWMASRRQLRKSARTLLSGGDQETNSGVGKKSGQTRWPLGIAIVCLLAALGLVLTSKSPEVFFTAGSLLLISGLAGGLAWLRHLAADASGLDSLNDLGMRNTARRRGRSLATVGVLASGVFIVVAVDSFRHRPLEPGATDVPGTGGFDLIGESASPIYDDLTKKDGILDSATIDGVEIVQLRVRAGDDASCLNLNRALQPRLLGVKTDEFARRSAFLPKSGGNFTWRSLDKPEADGAVPGVVDAATLQWALQKKIGDTIEYRDDRGNPVLVRIIGTIAGSILQGNIIISEDAFVRHFPSIGGYRYFLIKTPPDRIQAVRTELSRALEDRGLELTPTVQRLAEFQAVENTYLSIFQVLGGLGVLLGSAGLAIVVARNVLERRGEFGLLEAVGFGQGQLRRLVFAEHRWLIVAALVIGTASAVLAVFPNLIAQASGFPVREMALLLAAMGIGCLFWTWLATRVALRGSALPALRSE